jgi:tetratricopeptide (TPR) repeat protein
MLDRLVLAYYVFAFVYLLIQLLSKREGIFIKGIILLSCPFISIFLIHAMSKKLYSKHHLPDWLLRREQYDDVVIKPPDIEEETNVIPFQDALILNNNKTKRKILMDLLKGDFLQNVDALELALHSEDSETSHYAATAIQQVKSELLKKIRKLEQQLLEDNRTDAGFLESYRDLLKNYIKIEFLDERTRRKQMFIYIKTLNQLILLSPKYDTNNYIAKIDTLLQLGEYQEAVETAEQFLSYFPNEEEAYFSAMNVHYSMRNTLEFKKIISKLRSSDIQLSPGKLNQLRFWLSGE